MWQDPRRGEIWRDFKGGQYRIIGISEGTSEKSVFSGCPTDFALDTETLQEVAIFWSGDSLFLVDRTLKVIDLPHVVYVHVDGGTIWVRLLSNFMADLGTCYRFELMQVERRGASQMGDLAYSRDRKVRK